jgi:branched-chain amino acid transport system substrate-binding protein
MRLTMILAVTATLIFGALPVSCRVNGPGSGTIELGAVYNLDGSQSVLDVPSFNGSKLAVSQLNENGGVLGRELSLRSLNGESDVASLRAKTEAFLEENPDIVALLGLSDTDMVLAAAPAAATAGRVFLTSGATSPKLPAQVPDWLFLACFGDNVQAAAGAEWSYNELGVRTALVLYDPNESYPNLLQGYFVDRFEELGGTVTGTHAIEPRADNVELPELGNPGLVFLSVETADDAARVIPLLREAGYDGPILGGDGYDAESVWSESSDIENVYFSTHVYLGADSPSPKVRAFLDAYGQAYPGEKPSAFAALGYDAVGLLAAAIEATGEATPEAVRDGLAGIENYKGVTGTISFTDGSRIPKKSVTILQVTGGKQRFVAEVLPQSVPQP